VSRGCSSPEPPRHPGEVSIEKSRKEHAAEYHLKRAPADPVLTMRLQCDAKNGIGSWLHYGGNGPRLARLIRAGPVELWRINCWQLHHRYRDTAAIVNELAT
jgi:hypothetical protein